jgi:type I restriction enzyme R subunit
MASNLIFEDDIERDIIKVFESEALGFDYLNCYTANREDLNDKSNRADKKQVVLLDRLRIALKRLNSELPDDAI